MNIVIVGMGKYGTLLTSHLSKENHDIVVVDTNAKVIEEVVNKYDVKGYVGNGASYVTQENAGLNKFDLLIATTSTDEVNILTCLVAKKLGIKQTIARVRNPEYSLQAQMMQNELGISMTINPDYNTALEIFRTIRFPSALTVESFANGKVDLVEIKIEKDSLLNGKSLIEIKEKYKTNLLFCSVVRGEDVFIPNGNFILQEDDYVYITVSARSTTSAFKKLKIFKQKPKTVMIIGGGKISYYLVQLLIDNGIAVKIIEKDYSRRLELSQSFPEALVLNGDATHHELLLSEGVGEMDAFVTLTGQDETNIILSTYAKECGCEKVITKITNGSYDLILEKTGLESVVEPKELFANNIIRYARGMTSSRGSEFKTLYRLVDNKVEASEFFISKPAKYTSVPLKDLKIKKNVLLACIIRKNKVIIPSGLDTIEPLDSVIVVSSDFVIKDVNDILEK
jgi:trk system potassium uptake protein TrkA